MMDRMDIFFGCFWAIVAHQVIGILVMTYRNWDRERMRNKTMKRYAEFISSQKENIEKAFESMGIDPAYKQKDETIFHFKIPEDIKAGDMLSLNLDSKEVHVIPASEIN